MLQMCRKIDFASSLAITPKRPCFNYFVWVFDQKGTMNYLFNTHQGKSILQVPDTGTRVLDNTRPFLRSRIVSFWITPAHSEERKYHIFRQYWYTQNIPVFTNTGTFQYMGPEVYFFPHQIYNFLRQGVAAPLQLRQSA